jgi:hypothetical protein
MHGVTSKKIAFSIVTAVRPSDPKKKFNHGIHTELLNQLETPCTKTIKQTTVRGPIYGEDRRKMA